MFVKTIVHTEKQQQQQQQQQQLRFKKSWLIQKVHLILSKIKNLKLNNKRIFSDFKI